MENELFTIKDYGSVRIDIKQRMDTKGISRNALARACNTRFEVINKSLLLKQTKIFRCNYLLLFRLFISPKNPKALKKVLKAPKTSRKPANTARSRVQLRVADTLTFIHTQV